MNYKSCGKCGRIHPANYDCKAVKRIYVGGNERTLRSTYRWTEKSKEIREKANYLCEVCRDKGVYTYDSLEVHHITKVKEKEEGLLDDFNLICLCVEHHKKADNNELDTEYLKQLARERESR